jgi:hypothetical protein
MLLNRVTVTGADDTVKPAELIELGQRYPFLEFGILLSPKSVGSSRFPTVKWQQELTWLLHGLRQKVQLSAHLCGDYVRQAFRGYSQELEQNCPLWPYFGRTQLNTHGHQTPTNLPQLITLVQRFLRSGKQTIFQFDGENTNTLLEVSLQTECAALFDISHGAGKSPDRWSRPFGGYCGYAGGLSPDNVEDELKRIARQHGDDPAWIDAETKLFRWSDSGPVFDFREVERFAQAAKPWLSE